MSFSKQCQNASFPFDRLHSFCGRKDWKRNAHILFTVNIVCGSNELEEWLGNVKDKSTFFLQFYMLELK